MPIDEVRGHNAEEIGMAKATVYYFTFFDVDKRETVRPRRPGTLEAIANTCMTSVKPLIRTAQDVDESELDRNGFYLGRYRSLQDV
jgi:hypothetical protein